MVRQYQLIHRWLSIIYFVCLHVCTYRLTKDKGMMVLGRDQYYCVSVCEEKDSIRLSFILLSGGRHSAIQRIELLQYFQHELEMVMENFMQASTKPVAYIPCCFCDELHVEFQRLIKGEQQHCTNVGKPTCIPDEHYLDLIINKGVFSFLINKHKLIILMYSNS